MGGTQRAAKFVKYLPEFGWEPLVVTVKDVAYYAKDATLLDEIKDAQIHRTGSLDPQRLLAKFTFSSPEKSFPKKSNSSFLWQKLNSLASFIFIPDTKVLWLPFAFLKARQIIKMKTIDCILTSSPPNSVHLLGYFLKWFTNISWVADFRDGWSEGNFQKEPTAFHKWVNRLLEKKCVRYADRVIGVSNGLVAKLIAKSEMPSTKFHMITNGFDAQDFSGIEPTAENQKYTISYCGALTPIAPLDSFFEALAELLHTHPQLAADMCVNIAGGEVNSQIEHFIEKFNLKKVVKVLDYLSHGEAVMLMASSDLLLYPIAHWASRDFIPGKTFEYLASGRRILAIGPNVEGMEILKSSNRADHFSHDNKEGIKAALLERYNSKRQMRPAELRGFDLSQYERRQLTKTLASVLDSMVKLNKSNTIYGFPQSYLEKRLQILGFAGLTLVIDAACGTGEWTRPLAKLNRTVAAFDIDVAPLQQARRYLNTVNVCNAQLIQADMLTTPIKANSADAIFCFDSLMFANPAKALKGFHEILKKGGRVYLVVNGFGWVLYCIFHRGLKQRNYAKVNMGLRMIFDTFLRRIFFKHYPVENTFFTKYDLQNLAEASGFRVLHLGFEGTFKNANFQEYAPCNFPKYFGATCSLEILMGKNEF